MINSTLQLNDFRAKMGVKTQGEVLAKLIETQERISFEVAKLIQSQEICSLPR